MGKDLVDLFCQSVLRRQGEKTMNSIQMKAIESMIKKVIQELLQTVIQNHLLNRPVWLTTEQVANLLQICPTTLEKARSTGAGPLSSLPFHKIGRSVRYKKTDIETFMASKKVPVSKKINNFSGEMLGSNVRTQEK